MSIVIGLTPQAKAYKSRKSQTIDNKRPGQLLSAQIPDICPEGDSLLRSVVPFALAFPTGSGISVYGQGMPGLWMELWKRLESLSLPISTIGESCFHHLSSGYPHLFFTNISSCRTSETSTIHSIDIAGNITSISFPN